MHIKFRWDISLHGWIISFITNSDFWKRTSTILEFDFELFIVMGTSFCIGVPKYDQNRLTRQNNAPWGLLRCSWSLKVTDVGTNRKPLCDFLLVIYTNWHTISYRFEVVADYCSNFGRKTATLRFWALLWWLRGNVRCSSEAHWKALSGLLFSDNWTFFARCYGWGATSEYRLKVDVIAGTGLVWPKISRTRGRPLPTIFCPKTRWMSLLYGVKISAEVSFVLSQLHAF